MRKGWYVMSLKSIGIVRKVDKLGRIVLPIELRRTLDIAQRDAVEIFVDGGSIIIKKYEPEIVKGGRGKKFVCDVCKREVESR